MNKKLGIVIFIIIVIILLGCIIFSKIFNKELIKSGNNVYDASDSKINQGKNSEDEREIYNEIKKANQEAEKIKESNSNEISEEEKQQLKEEINQIETELKEALPNNINYNER